MESYCQQSVTNESHLCLATCYYAPQGALLCCLTRTQYKKLFLTCKRDPIRKYLKVSRVLPVETRYIDIWLPALYILKLWLKHQFTGMDYGHVVCRIKHNKMCKKETRQNLDCDCNDKHVDVMKWKLCPRNWWIPRTKADWRGALMFSLICVWINGWENNREAGDLRRYHAHYDVIVMKASPNITSITHS